MADLSRRRALEGEMLRRVERDHVRTSAAFIDLLLRKLPDDVRTRTLDAVRNGTGKVELRTPMDTPQTELVLVPTDGTEALWLARTGSAK